MVEEWGFLEIAIQGTSRRASGEKNTAGEAIRRPT